MRGDVCPHNCHPIVQQFKVDLGLLGFVIEPMWKRVRDSRQRSHHAEKAGRGSGTAFWAAVDGCVDFIVALTRPVWPRCGGRECSCGACGGWV
jgi:hypothetical protein